MVGSAELGVLAKKAISQHLNARDHNSPHQKICLGITSTPQTKMLGGSLAPPPILLLGGSLADTLAWATGTRVGANDHAMALCCILYGRVLGFLYMNTFTLH